MTEHTTEDSRADRHQEVLAAGGYPYRFERSDLAADLQERHGHLEPETVTETRASVAGRLMLQRSFGKLQFGTMMDVSGSIQLFVDESVAGSEIASEFGAMDLGDWVGAEGQVMTTRKGELSIRVDGLTLLQRSLHPLPDKWHGLADIETRSRQRYLDLMVNEEARNVALSRARIVGELRKQFGDRGFVEVETPVLLTEATGALARPFLTHHNALDVDLQMRIATELYLKRLVVGGIERVFEVGRIFRNEGIDATHNPEFTMLEAYQAFADYKDVMVLIEEIFSAVAEAANGSTDVSYQGRGISLSPPYRRVTMIDLVSEFVGNEVGLGSDPEDLRTLLEQRGGSAPDGATAAKLLFELYELAYREILEPTFVIDFPREVSPLARTHREDDRLTERFELVIAGAEYCNAFSELNDPADQLARFEAQAAARAGGDDEAHVVDYDYVKALEYGMPPTGGLGIGVDRLVMLLTNQTHIRDVILFPLMRPLREGDQE